jgi:hypothetical protein
MNRGLSGCIMPTPMLWLVRADPMKRVNGFVNVQRLISTKLQMLINELKSNLHLHPQLNSEQ